MVGEGGGREERGGGKRGEEGEDEKRRKGKRGRRERVEGEEVTNCFPSKIRD